jgi:hypothetical protein
MKMDNETAGWYSTVLDNLSQGFCIIEMIAAGTFLKAYKCQEQGFLKGMKKI